MKEVLEPGRTHDLDHARRHVAGVPHSVHLPTRLGDVPNGAEYGLTIPRSKADFSLRDDRVLVLAGVEMGRNKSTDGERVFHNRDLALVSRPQKLEGDTNHAQVAGSSFAGLQNGKWWWTDGNHEATLPFLKQLAIHLSDCSPRNVSVNEKG
jgi:hypothetical protein